MLARRWWCRLDEPILWAIWQDRTVFRVPGLDEAGVAKDPVGVRIGRGLGRAAASTGSAALYVLGTAAFGGGDDSGVRSSAKEPDLTVAGEQKNCAAVQLMRSELPERCGILRTLWVATPSRVGVLGEVWEPSGARSKPPKTDWAEMGRVLVGRQAEEFGENEPGEPIPIREVIPWFEFAPTDISDFGLVGDKKQPQWRHCALQLADGSGFVLNGKTPADAQHMVEAMRRGWGRG